MRLKANLTLFAVAIIWGTGFITQAVAGKYHVAYLFNGEAIPLISIAGLLLIVGGIFVQLKLNKR